MHVIANISLQLPTSLCSVSITDIANYFATITITVSLDHQQNTCMQLLQLWTLILTHPDQIQVAHRPTLPLSQYQV